MKQSVFVLTCQVARAGDPDPCRIVKSLIWQYGRNTELLADSLPPVPWYRTSSRCNRPGFR